MIRRHFHAILPRPADRRMFRAMIRFFDIDDHARLPWRFHGLSLLRVARA